MSDYAQIDELRGDLVNVFERLASLEARWSRSQDVMRVSKFDDLALSERADRMECALQIIDRLILACNGEMSSAVLSVLGDIAHMALAPRTGEIRK